MKLYSVLRHLWAKSRNSSKYINIYFKTWEWLLWLNSIISIRSEFKSICLNISTTSASPIKDLKYIYIFFFSLRQTPWHVNTTTSHHSKGLNVHLITVENTLKVQQQEDERKAPDTAGERWDSQSIGLLLGGLLLKPNPSSSCWRFCINLHLFQRDCRKPPKIT